MATTTQCTAPRGSRVAPSYGQGVRMARALERALRADQFVLHYQPIVDLGSGRVFGLEGLVRWERPRTGLTGPDSFIPGAEASGLIVELGEWVVRRACADAAGWPRPDGSGSDLMVSVNLSPVQLADPALAARVERALDDAGLPAGRLCLELTETPSIGDADRYFSERLHDLKAMGVKIAFDDFGTQFATLAAIQRFPSVDLLKIDREFVAGLPGSQACTILARTIAGLAHSVGASAVAEGVENEQQLAVVAEVGCDLAQGFYFAPPLPTDEVGELLAGDPVLRQPAGTGEVPGEPVEASVLVVDDDRGAREALTRTLAAAGYAVTEAADGRSGRRALEERAVDLLVLDLELPDMDGLELLAPAGNGDRTPTLVVSGRSSEEDRVRGLARGADDYLVKPFAPRELVARAGALLRRSRGSTTLRERLDFGDLRIDATSREVWLRGEPVATTPKEFELLAFLARHPRQAFSRAQLLREVWGSEPAYQVASTVTEHVRRLRQKIESDPARPRWIATVRGMGYRFDA